VKPYQPNIPPSRDPPRPKPKRVYKTVSVDEQAGRFRVLLDGKPVQTPLRVLLSTTHRALAEAVGAEWDAQLQSIDPATMPLTRLVSTSLDKVSPERAAMIEQLMNYADEDLLCYRAGFPADLKARQTEVWQPVLDWLEGAFGITLTAAEGIMPHGQTDAAHAGLRRVMAVLDDEHFTALQACASITNSLALSLALTHGHLSAAEIYAAAVLDETYQMEQWGADALALERHRHIEVDLLAIGEYLRLVEG
jgi:chaperone required for assembly of F1-ATPase